MENQHYSDDNARSSNNDRWLVANLDTTQGHRRRLNLLPATGAADSVFDMVRSELQ